jgi:hypothetical protein
MFPSHLDSGSHIVCQDDELRRPAVIMGAKAYDVDLSHSGRKIAKKPGESKGDGLGVRGHQIIRASVRSHARNLAFAVDLRYGAAKNSTGGSDN